MSETGETVIAVKGLKIGYGEKVLMEKLDFEVRRGEVFVILGGSGCGKSSLASLSSTSSATTRNGGRTGCGSTPPRSLTIPA